MGNMSSVTKTPPSNGLSSGPLGGGGGGGGGGEGTVVTLGTQPLKISNVDKEGIVRSG